MKLWQGPLDHDETAEYDDISHLPLPTSADKGTSQHTFMIGAAPPCPLKGLDPIPGRSLIVDSKAILNIKTESDERSFCNIGST